MKTIVRIVYIIFVFQIQFIPCFSQRVLQHKPLYIKNEISNNVIRISWNVDSSAKHKVFRVFKMDESNPAFHQIKPGLIFKTEKKLLILTFTDSITKGSSFARYYMSTLDSKGKGIPVSDTITVSLTEKNKIPVPEHIRVLEDKDNSTVRLSWQLSSNTIINYISIYRSIKYDSLYEKIADVGAKDSVFMDVHTEPMQKYYYYLVSRGFLGEESYPSLKVFAIPQNAQKPDFPRNIHAESAKNGVMISWPSADDFINGYYIYRGMGKGLPMEQISGFIKKGKPETVYIDSSHVIKGNKLYTYAIQSESRSYVKSDMSDTVLVRPGKPTEPMTPFGMELTVHQKGIKIYWQDMTVLEDNLLGYQLYRRESGGKTKYALLNSKLLGANSNSFLDTTALPGIKYEYALESIDIFNGHSKLSSPATGQVKQEELVAPAMLRYYPSDKGIILEWDEVYGDNIAGFNIYRYKRGEKPVLLTSVDRNITVFEDNTVKSNNTYLYYLTSYNGSKVESNPSESIVVER
jgi:fibronectin type 3 domain-containing protein